MYKGERGKEKGTIRLIRTQLKPQQCVETLK